MINKAYKKCIEKYIGCGDNELSLKKVLCCELTAGTRYTLSQIQINVANHQPNKCAHRENCVQVFHFQKQLKIFQFKYQVNMWIFKIPNCMHSYLPKIRSPLLI